MFSAEVARLNGRELATGHHSVATATPEAGAEAPMEATAKPKGCAPGGPGDAARVRVDKRTRRYRRWVSIVAELTAEMGGALTVSETLDIERAALLAVGAEEMRERILAGGAIQADDLVRVYNAAAREMAKLRGKRRVVKSAGHSKLQAFMARREAAA